MRLALMVMSCLTSCAPTNNLPKGFSMQVTRNNETPKKYKNIMIAGFGTSVTRLFFDNLYDALRVELLKANIISEKKFTGNDSIVVVPAINKLIESQAYDAVLIIAPHSGGFVTEKNIANPLAKNELERNFKFNVFDKIREFLT